MEEIKNQLENLLKTYNHNKELLTYNEVLYDKKLTNKLLKENSKIKIVCESYEEYKNILKEIEKLKNQIENVSENEKKYFLDEINTLNEKLKIEENNILINFAKLNSKEENVVIELYSNDKTFVNFILKNYINICENNSFDYSLNENEIKINGKGVNEIFKNESGIHKKIDDEKESTCNIFVFKNIEKESYSFNEKDIKIEAYHSSGAGGQNINKVSTAIRATHLKTNITVNCQNERSQFQNKEKALSLLKEKVETYYNEKLLNEIKKQKKEQEKIINQGFVVRIYDINKKDIKSKNSVNNLIEKEFLKTIKMEKL